MDASAIVLSQEVVINLGTYFERPCVCVMFGEKEKVRNSDEWLYLSSRDKTVSKGFITVPRGEMWMESHVCNERRDECNERKGRE